MNDVKKPNDWFVAQIDNPSFTMNNFKDVGLSADNTGLLDRNTYKNSNYVQEKFKDDNGKFNDVAFNRVYDAAAQTYQKFANDDFENSIMEDVEWDPYSTIRPDNAKVKDIDFGVQKVLNPDRRKTGVSGIQKIDNKEWSASELAQKEKVFDITTGKYKEYAPNDNILFGNPLGFLRSISEPLVLAQWDEAGEHKDPYTGRLIKHDKGELKYNDEGTYYYETLGSREAYGRKFKSAFDSFTVDKGSSNKYDFFDSDGLDKSVTGTVMKTVASLAPLFVPYVNVAYGGAMIGAQLLDILPSIYKSTIGLRDTNTPTANLLQGIGRTLKGSKTDYSQEHLASTENFFELVTDVALQWGQQRTIFKGISKLLGTEAKQRAALNAATSDAVKKAMLDPKKYGAALESGSLTEMAQVKAAKAFETILKRDNRMAANTALGYMALMQGLGTFEDAIAQGVDRSEASAVAWGAIAGMYAVDRTGLGELFFPELKTAVPTYRQAIKNITDNINQSLKVLADSSLPKPTRLAKIFGTAKEQSANYWSDIRNHTAGFAVKAVAEGVEEVSEELVMDFSKATFNWASDMGATKSGKKLDAFKDAGTRYGMSFFGGALGGAIFHGVDLVQNAKTSEQTNQELIYLIRNNKSGELVEELGKMREKSKLGNKNLSATKTETTKDGTVWTSPTDASDNQNEAVYNMTKSYIQHLDAVINQEGLNFSDDQLLDKMMMGDMRMKAMLQIEKADGERFGKAMLNGYNGTALQDFNKLVSKIVAARKDIESLQTLDADKKSPTYDADLKKKLQEKADLDLEKQKFLDGSFAEHYTDQMMFAIDTNINHFFYSATFKDFAEYKTKQDFNDLPQAQVDSLKPEYEAYKQQGKMEALDAAYGIYKKLNKGLSAKLEEGNIKYDEYYKFKTYALETLVDAKATIDKLEIPEGADAGQVLVSKFGVDKSLNPVLNKKFVRETFTEKAGETEEEAEARLSAVELQNQEVLGKVQEMVQVAQGFGFMDSEVKELLLSSLGDKISNERAMINVVSEMYNNGTISIKADLDGNIIPDPLGDTLLTVLNKADGENLEEITKTIHDTINSEEHIKQLTNNVLDTFDETGEAYASEDAENVTKAVKDKATDLEKTYVAAAKAINSSILADPYNSTVLALRKNVLQLKTSPVYEYLQDVSKTTYGSASNLIDLLEQERRRFAAAPSVTDYILDGNKAKEIEEAYNVVQMLNSVIVASSTVGTSTNNPFGHNSAMNYFLETYFPKEEKYGVIREDIAVAMSGELEVLNRQLLFLKNLSDMNSINQFSKHARTGQRISKLTYEVLKGKGKYAFLKELSYNGMRLFEGVDIMPTPVLDNVEDEAFDNPLISKELADLENRVYDNFQNIIKTVGVSAKTVLEEMFSNLGDKFDIINIISQKNTKFSPETTFLEDYDVYMMLHALVAIKKSDYDYHLREVLGGQDVKYAPLYAQDYAAYMAVAMAVNPEVMNAAVNNIPTAKGTYGSELIKYWNTIMVDGIGGAGKTAVIAKLTQGIIKQLYPNATTWKVGPSAQQVDNLVASLGSEGKAFSIDDLMKHILGEETYSELSNDISNSSTTSNQYEVVTFDGIKHPNGEVYDGYTASVIKPGTEYNTTGTPKVIFIDEGTWINSLYMQHLSNWAKENDVTLVLLGDLNQNGFDNQAASIYNIKSDTALMVRTPKLDISLRLTNTQKDDNNKIVNSLLAQTNFAIIDQLGKTSNENIAKMMTDLIRKQLILHHHQSADYILNGEKIVDSISAEEIATILEKDGEIGYVYDNENTDTYKLLKGLNNDNIKFYTPKSVQGSEMTHFIVDIDFSSYNADSPIDIQLFLKSFYTMISRSKEGSYILNRGLSSFLDPKNLIADPKTSTTPEVTQVIQKFKEMRMAALDLELEGYSPTSMESTSEEPISSEVPTPAVKVKETYTPPVSKVAGANPVEDEFLADPDNNNIESIITEPMTGIRAYGWYMRYGMVQDEEGNYERVVKDDVVDDLNVFTRANVTYTDKTIYTPKQLLVDVRNYLSFGEPFDADFMQKLSDSGNGYLAQLGVDGWNSGSFYLEIRKDDTNTMGTDRAKDKQGYDESKVESTAFNIVYRIPVSKGKDIQFTVGKLTNPDTWQKWDKDNGNKLTAKITQYKKWYKDMQGWATKNATDVKHLKIDNADIYFSKATRLKKVPDKTWNVDTLKAEFPNALISPLYIYSGNGNTATVHKSLKGKGVVFTTANKHLKIDGEKVTEANLADMYLKLQRKRQAVLSKAFDEAKANGMSDADAKTESEVVAAKVAPPLIRMVAVRSNGAYVNDYFTLSFSDLVYSDDKGINKLDLNQVRDHIGTYGSNTSAARMLMALWNYRSGLKNFNDAYASYKELNKMGEVRGQVEVDKFNRLIDQSIADGTKRVPWSSTIYNGFMFRLTYADSIKPNAPGMVVRPINLSKDEWEVFDTNGKVPRQLTYGTYIDPKVAQAQLTILDSIFKALGEYLTFPENTGFTIRAEGKDMENILGQLLADDGAIEFTDGESIYKHPASSLGNLGGAFKVISLLSSVYKLYTKGHKGSSAYTFTAKSKDGQKKAINLFEVDETITRAAREAGKTSTFSLLNNLFNTAFHGTPTIKEGAATTTYAPFIHGILYTPRYQTSHDSQISDFYPARNHGSQFYSDVAIESPNMEVVIDPTQLKEANFEEVIPRNKKQELGAKLDIIRKGVSDSLTGYASLDTVIDKANKQYEEKGDIALDDIVKDFSSSVDIILQQSIKDKTLMRDNSPVIHLETSISDTGFLTVINVVTLLDEIDTKSGSLLPKTKDGIIDTSAIQNIEYNGSNLQDFTVTLQSGQSITGTINGAEVVITDTVMYEVPFSADREQKLQIYEDILNDHDNLRETEIMELIRELRATKSISPEQAEALLTKAKLVDSHFENYLTDEQFDDSDITSVQEYINSLATNKSVIDSQECKFNI